MKEELRKKTLTYKIGNLQNFENIRKQVNISEISDDMLTRIIEKSDKYEIEDLTKNPYLNESQVKKLKDILIAKLRDMDPRLWDSSIESFSLDNLLSTYTFDENTIREMFNGSEVEKNAVISNCKNIPEDLIESVLEAPETYSTTEKNGRERYTCKNIYWLVSLLRNNQNLSTDLIHKFYDYSETVAKQYGNKYYFQKYLISQKNISEDMMIEIAKESEYPLVINSFLDRKEKPADVIEVFANSPLNEYREKIAEALANGEISVSMETLKKLATDNKIDDTTRIALLSMPDFTEQIDDIDEKDMSFYINYRDVAFGGDGPGSFDNKGGERRFFINGFKILSERGYTSSYATDAEGRKWARNAYTDFSMCKKIEDFKQYCNEHKEAIVVIARNQEQYGSFYNLTRRVEMIENAIRESTKTKNEIEASISEVKTSDIEQVCDEISRKVKAKKKDITLGH